MTCVRTIIGRAKRAPHRGVQSRFCVIYNSASEAKLTNRREIFFKFLNKVFKKYSLENRKCLEMPRAYVHPTTLMRMNNSYKMQVDDRRCPIRNVC